MEYSDCHSPTGRSILFRSRFVGSSRHDSWGSDRIRQINHSLSEGLFDCSVLHICSSWASIVFVLDMGKHNIWRRIG